MCGINGIISSSFDQSQRAEMVLRMNRCLAHRGPDHDGTWSEGDVTLGHRRLSIIDLSDEGNQPFHSSDNRYTIVYNGELYNYRELKLELQRSAAGTSQVPYFFRTDSDTEVILAAYVRWGTQCLDKFNGMFAFAIYDRQTGEVFAARDPLGVKPFYYSYNDTAFIFSSEIRAILQSKARHFSLNHSVLAEYSMYQTVHAPATIVKEIKVLMPGHYLQYARHKATITSYYSLSRIATSPDISYEEACTEVRNLLAASVQRRLVADVPFGAFLSGGIDSSAVVALMSQVSTSQVKTFNISFDESGFSESRYAKIIAEKYGTDHHEIRLTPADFLKQLPEALAAMDHPGGDGPNTYIVSKATRQAGITMALSGVGGDELFAGYDVFKRVSEIARRKTMTQMPLAIRKLGAALIAARRKDMAGKKMAELLSLRQIDFVNSYPLFRSLFTKRDLNKLSSGDAGSHLRQIMSNVPQNEEQLLSAVSVAEISTYMQNVLLRDADQMGMAVALEIREPFLDKHLVQFVLSLKDSFKYPVTPKKLLVDSMGPLLPAEIVNRPKMGFVLPWKQWLANELRPFMETQVRELEERKLFHQGAVESLWRRYLAGDVLVSWSRVWHLAVLNDWLRKNHVV